MESVFIAGLPAGVFYVACSYLCLLLPAVPKVEFGPFQCYQGGGGGAAVGAGNAVPGNDQGCDWVASRGLLVSRTHAGWLKLMTVQSSQSLGLILRDAEDLPLPLISRGTEGIEHLRGSGLVCAVFWGLILSSG